MVRPLPPAVMRTASARRAGDCVAGLPFFTPPRLKTRVASHPRRHYWLAILAGLALLAVAPLLAHSEGTDSVTVSWTAAGDDGEFGTAAIYDLRVSESPITADNFSAAATVQDAPAPATSGTRQQAMVRGLTRGTTYYFAIRSRDDAGNWSAISNVLRWTWIIDQAPPGVPQGLAARRDANQVRVSWSANSDPDLRGYNLYRALTASGPFIALNTTPLATTEFVDALPADAAQLWYQISAVDANGNESARSAAIELVLAADTHAEVAMEAAYPNPSHAGDPVRIPVVVPVAAASAVVIDVVDGGGRRVRRIERDLAAGRQDVEWDGRNDAGRLVAPGVYRAWLIAGGARTSIRLLRVP